MFLLAEKTKLRVALVNNLTEMPTTFSKKSGKKCVVT